MTTPVLSAAVASPAPEQGRAPAGAKQADDGPSFDSVLNGRPATKPQDRPTAHNGPDKKTTVSQDGKHDDAKDAGDDTSGVAAEPNLPQLALYIAAQANPSAPVTRQPESVDAQTDSRGAHAAIEAASAARAGAANPPAQIKAAASSDTAKPDVPATAAPTAPAPSVPGGKPSPATVAAANEAPHHQQDVRRPVPHAAASKTAAATENQSPAPQEPLVGKSAGGQPAPSASVATAKMAMAKLESRGHADRERPSPSRTDATMPTMAFAPASNQGSAPAGQPSQPGIAVSVQSPQWAGEFGRQFVSLTQSGHATGSHTAQLRLDPPNLGPLHISINISDNIAHAVFFSPHAAVRHAVENALPQLQQQLAQAGISLGQTSVSDHGTSHDAPGGSSTGKRRPASTAALPGIAASAPAGMPAAAARGPVPNAIVDTFA